MKEFHVFLTVFLLFPLTGLSQPILQQITNFLSGIKYVPPQTGIFAATTTALPKVEENFRSDNEEGGVIFASEEEWLQPAGSSYLYKLGIVPSTFSEAKYWCLEEGGRLAEIYNSEEMKIIKELVARDSESNFWIGLEKPHRDWFSSRKPLEYTNWAKYEPVLNINKRCTFLWGKENFAWADGNCGSKRDQRIPVKALCQKELNAVISAKETDLTNPTEFESDFKRQKDHCTVENFSLVGENWIRRINEIHSSESCHQECLEFAACRFWTWRRDSKLCYMKSADGPVIADKLAISGTTSSVQGCNHSLLENKQPRIEYCSCKQVSQTQHGHLVTDGYIDPRSLYDFQEEGSGSLPENKNLGRLIVQSVCPENQVLTCEDEQEKVIEKEVRGAKSNITDCLVNDVRLSVGGLISKIFDVQNPETCHAHCLATPGCAYWTWRGDTLTKKCFLKPNEGRTIRRQGAAAGTVLRNLGCDHKIINYIPTVSEKQNEEYCHCEENLEEDLVSQGLINPRTLPLQEIGLGRIVGTNNNECPIGYKKVCPTKKNIIRKPKLFTGGLSIFQ